MPQLGASSSGSGRSCSPGHFFGFSHGTSVEPGIWKIFRYISMAFAWMVPNCRKGRKGIPSIVRGLGGEREVSRLRASEGSLTQPRPGKQYVGEGTLLVHAFQTVSPHIPASVLTCNNSRCSSLKLKKPQGKLAGTSEVCNASSYLGVAPSALQ